MYFYEAQVSIGEVERFVLVVFSGQLEGDEIVYSQLIESGFRKYPNRPEEVFFIYPSYIDDVVSGFFESGERAFENVVRFGEEIPVTFLPFDKKGELSLKAVHGASLICEDLDELRDQLVGGGIFNLAKIRKNDVIQKSPSGTVFIKPSGQEYDEFIKASELAVGYAENQFVGFSLLSKVPEGRDIKRIYIDTNSISSFIESLLYYWARFSDSKCKTAVYYSYGSYGGMDAAKPEDVEDVWLIISASRTNSMGVKMARNWGLEDNQVITLLSYTKSHENNVGDQILVDISALSESAQKDIAHGSMMKVKVWGENFTAEVEKPNLVYILAEHKTPAINMLVYPNNSNGLFKLNRRVSPELPVSSIYVDCTKHLSEDKKLISWLEDVIDWYIPPKLGWLVYKERDESSKNLTSLVEKKLLSNGITGFRKVDINVAHKEISGDDSVLVAIPATATGQTLLKLNRNLRISGHKGNRIFISPFVVSQSKSAFIQFKNSLIYAPKRMKYLFFSWRDMYIGHSEEINSWAQELKVVEHLDSPFWIYRANALRNNKDGLCGAIGTPSVSVDDRLTFTKDFAFWGENNYDPEQINPESVYVTVASILQDLREKPLLKSDKNSLFSYVYQHSVIAPDNFTRFTDALLQSCLWRAANGRELDYRSSLEISQEFSGILERLIEENSNGTSNAAVDLLMGIATGRIQLSREVLKELLKKASCVYKDKNSDAVLLIEYIGAKHFPADYPLSSGDVVL
tara:strand:+ start:35581 stop:37809 length:2229 start_codon:yes stop_codon:yes gene_type:complete